MKYVRLFENFDTNDIDDILIEYIENNKCIKSGSEHYQHYYFSDKTDFDTASNRLEDFGLEPNYSGTSIFFIDFGLEMTLNSMFRNLIKKEYFDGNKLVEYREKTGKFIMTYRPMDKRLFISYKSVFSELQKLFKVSDTNVPSILLWYVTEILNMDVIKVVKYND